MGVQPESAENSTSTWRRKTGGTSGFPPGPLCLHQAEDRGSAAFFTLYKLRSQGASRVVGTRGEAATNRHTNSGSTAFRRALIKSSQALSSISSDRLHLLCSLCLYSILPAQGSRDGGHREAAEGFCSKGTTCMCRMQPPPTLPGQPCRLFGGEIREHCC